jgi:pimeloyl-ACP methyl ester carboxylesterase
MPMELIAGRTLETGWWGPGSGPALVLLHEGLGSVGLWRGFPAALAEATGLRVFAWSRLGYGRSAPVTPPRPLDYMQREAADGVRPVLDAAGIGDCVLIGHSDGASIAALYAGTVQDARVRGLVLLAPHFFVEDICIAGIEAARERYLHGDLRARLARHHDDVDGAFWGWNGAWLDPGFRTWNITEAAARIRVPTLVVQGLADPYGTAEQARTAERLIPAPVETLLLPGVGHAPHLEAAEATRAAVTRFIRPLLRPSPAI